MAFGGCNLLFYHLKIVVSRISELLAKGKIFRGQWHHKLKFIHNAFFHLLYCFRSRFYMALEYRVQIA